MAAKKALNMKKLWPIIAAALGIVLMLVPRLSGEKEVLAEEEDSTQEAYLYSEKLEERLTELISGAKDVGSARVVVTLDRSCESVFATNEKVSDKSISVDYVILGGGDEEKPIPISEIYPVVRGVAVVCEGGERAEVRERVTLLISAALGISTARIAVSG